MTFKQIFPSSLHKNARVTEIIGSKNQWEEGLIRQNFKEEDAEAIIKIPLLKGNKDDGMLWHFDKKKAIFG